MGNKGSVGDDSEPLELKKHSAIQIDNADDLRINVLMEYISKVPGARIQDLKKSLEHYSKFTDEEFKNLVKTASLEKYKELYHSKHSSGKSNLEIVYLPKVNIISEDTIASGFPYRKDELAFVQTHSSELQPRYIYEIYKKAFPNSQRNRKFIGDCKHLTKMHPEKYIIKELPKQQQIQINHDNISSNHHILAQAINSLYKSGKSPKIFSQIKPVLELINDPSEIEFAIECLTS